MNYLVVRVFKSILDPPTLFGLPRLAFFVLAGLTVSMVVSLQQFWFIPVAVLLYITFRIIGKKDPHIINIYRQVLKIPEELD